MDLFYHRHRARRICFPAGLLCLAGRLAAGASLEALPEHFRPDPFGGVVSADVPAGSPTPKLAALRGARRGYVSFHLVAKIPEAGEYTLDLQLTDRSSKLQVEAYREWFHFTDSDKHYYPDALAPIQLPYRSRLPEPDNRIEKQTAQAFWMDMWIPPDARAGIYRLRATLASKGAHVDLPLELQVLSPVIPNEDAVTMDHNTYGTSWMAEQYPNARTRAAGDFFQSDELFRLIHAYHRIFYENRGIYH